MALNYYSNWNKNNRPTFKQVVLSLLKWPMFALQKIKQEPTLRRKIFRISLYLFCTLLMVGSLTFATVSLTLPDPNKLNGRVIPQSTRIYARDGTTLLYEIHGEAKRTLIELDDIPDYAKKATISIEDKNFYKNTGIDWTGIARGVFGVFTSGNLEGPGGSTITQQFVKNAILTKEANSFQKISRKIKEIVLAVEINQKFSKDEILKLYLNEIPYGQNAYGIEAASQTYFGKHAKDLSLGEAAYLAALPQAPSFFNPNGPNRGRLDNRKNLVLSEMYTQGYITKQQRDDAQAEKVNFGRIKDSILAPHFVLYVQNLLAEKYGEKTLEEGGLKVITTLDWNMQQAAEKSVTDGVTRNEKNNKAENAGLVAINPKDGQILAMVGSRGFFDEEHDGQVNVTLRDLQPGSSIKPYIYATAFKQGMSPATMIMDVRTNFGSYAGKDYMPGNYDGADHGIVNIRKALAGSLNVPAVKTLALVGVSNAIDTAKDMGITSDISADRCGLSLVLGGCELNLLDHASAMGVFANMGVRHDHTPILKVEDSKGNVLEEYKEDEGQQVLDPQVAYQIVDIMTDNNARSFIFGEKSPLILPDRVVGAKTGTTNEWRDGWTLGYTPSLVAGVWVGNNDHSKMRAGADGVVVAAPIWNQFMREALKGTPAETFTQPAGIQRVLVDSISGKLPTEYTPATREDVFSSNALPKDFDNVHVAVEVNKFNGKKANANTPAEARETRIYTVLHSEMPNNPNWENPVQAWAQANGYTYPPTEEDDGSSSSATGQFTLSFITPINGQTITSLPLTTQVTVNGTIPVSVDLYLNGNFIGSKTQSPFSFQINQASNGTQQLLAIARLPDGQTIQNSISINIQK